MRALAVGFGALLIALVLSTGAWAWTWPVQGDVVRPFLLGDDPYAGGQHRGVDIGAPVGSAVVAAIGGLVTFAGTVPSGGGTVTITTADGMRVTVQQLQALAVASGDAVSEGSDLGLVSASADAANGDPHVHLGIRDARGDYLDPLQLLGAGAADPAASGVAAPGGAAPADPSVSAAAGGTGPEPRVDTDAAVTADPGAPTSPDPTAQGPGEPHATDEPAPAVTGSSREEGGGISDSPARDVGPRWVGAIGLLASEPTPALLPDAETLSPATSATEPTAAEREPLDAATSDARGGDGTGDSVAAPVPSGEEPAMRPVEADGAAPAADARESALDQSGGRASVPAAAIAPRADSSGADPAEIPAVPPATPVETASAPGSGVAPLAATTPAAGAGRQADREKGAGDRARPGRGGRRPGDVVTAPRAAVPATGRAEVGEPAEEPAPPAPGLAEAAAGSAGPANQAGGTGRSRGSQAARLGHDAPGAPRVGTGEDRGASVPVAGQALQAASTGAALEPQRTVETLGSSGDASAARRSASDAEDGTWDRLADVFLDPVSLALAGLALIGVAAMALLAGSARRARGTRPQTPAPRCVVRRPGSAAERDSRPTARDASDALLRGEKPGGYAAALGACTPASARGGRSTTRSRARDARRVARRHRRDSTRGGPRTTPRFGPAGEAMRGLRAGHPYHCPRWPPTRPQTRMRPRAGSSSRLPGRTRAVRATSATWPGSASRPTSSRATTGSRGTTS